MTTPAPTPQQQVFANRRKLMIRVVIAMLVVAVVGSAAGLVWQHRDYARALVSGEIRPVPAAPNHSLLKLPPGFAADVYASGLQRPRFITFGPDGVLYVAEAGRWARHRAA